MKKLTRENLTAHELTVYRDYIKFGWLPYHLRDADGMLTELNWIEAMLDREEEGDAIFQQFCKDYEAMKKEAEKNEM